MANLKCKGNHSNSRKHSNEIVHISCFKHRYEDGTTVDLCNSHFCAEYGEIVVITGPNGSGKSTLLSHIVGMLSPTKGEIRIMGVDVSSKKFESIRREIGVVFQDADEQLVAPTVFDDIAFSPLNYDYPLNEINQMVKKIMNELHIIHLASKVPHYLSGGEKKKVALAGAVVMHPKLLVLDELFANLDQESRDEIAKFLIALNRKEKTTIIMSSHDENTVKKMHAREFPLNPIRK
jgi:cobalt/nickel transport system ATP-binding protein